MPQLDGSQGDNSSKQPQALTDSGSLLSISFPRHVLMSKYCVPDTALVPRGGMNEIQFPALKGFAASLEKRTHLPKEMKCTTGKVQGKG